MTNSKRPRAAATASKRSRRKARSESQEAHENLPERPKAPPPPPASLVKLLKNDSSVLSYFQALQANLDFDVQKWKTRARAHEQRCHQLTQEIQEYKKQTKESKATSQERPSPASEDQHAMASRPKDALTSTIAVDQAQEADMQNTTTTRPVVDKDFELESSSSEDDARSDTKSAKPSPQYAPARSSFGIHRQSTSFILSSSDDDDKTDIEENENDSTEIVIHQSLSVNETQKESETHRSLSPNTVLALQKLQRAKMLLEEVGVPLLEQVELRKESNHSENTDKCDRIDGRTLADAEPTLPVEYRRRNDEAVVADLLQQIKTLTRIKHKYNDFQYYPFQTTDIIPCYIMLSKPTSSPESNYPPHPAVAGVRSILQALCLLDVYCPAIHSLQEQDVRDHFIEGLKDPWNLVLGMRGRKKMVCDLVESLHGEIVRFWPYHDRTSRLSTVSTHLRTEESEATDEHSSPLQLDSFPTNNWIPSSAKNLVRLSTLVERCILVHLVTAVYMFRQDFQKVIQLFLSYILTAAPSISLEDYPRLPPVLSFCVLEAMMDSSPATFGDPNSETMQHNSLIATKLSFSEDLSNVLSSVFAITRDIYSKRAEADVDERIREISQVELAALKRLQLQHPLFLHMPLSTTTKSSVDAASKALFNCFENECETAEEEDGHALVLSLVLSGDAMLLDAMFDNALSRVQESPRSGILLGVYIQAKRELEIRQVDEYRRITQLPLLYGPHHTGKTSIHSLTERFVGKIITQQLDGCITVAHTALRACQSAGDGTSLLQMIRQIFGKVLKTKKPSRSFMSLMDDAVKLGNNTMIVRVINLERRPDRMAALVSQILQEGLFFVKGVASFDEKVNIVEYDNDRNFFFGAHAIDGKGKQADVELRMTEMLAGAAALNELVDTHWAPNELRPFDSEAPTSDTQRRIHATEKACALSHIATWKGILRSLSIPTEDKGMQKYSPRKWMASGFARGAALFPENSDMEPSPVVVVLEDDAILVDRFADRLCKLLEELPRDFHFCSIGYSRPKTAPIVPYSSQIGIPTAIWYLTGYILSMEGAEYLTSRIPVRGPVDSWIGLKMFANWDNVYGHAMGVGVSSNPNNARTVSKEELRRILRFRAFAAQVPLCTQRVRVGHHNGTAKGWRQRDTDIIYSGS